MADIVELITLQHRRVDGLLEQAEQAGPDQVTPLLQQVADLLIPHSQAEESFVYPAIQEYDRQEADDAHDAVAEHHHVEELLTQLLAEDPTTPGFDGKLAAMIGEIRHHVEEEESELLPVLTERASAEEREELGVRFAEVTGEELAAPVGSGRTPQPTSSEKSTQKSSEKSTQKAAEKSTQKAAEKSTQKAAEKSTQKAAGTSSGKDPVEGRSKDELYQLAKDKDIPGRSSMSKDELARALDEHR